MWLSRVLRRVVGKSRTPKLVVPAEFNRNSHTVSSLMSPEESGARLLERMRVRLGFDTFADKHLLDFGCGVRFTQAIINSELPVGRYVGVDNHLPVIEFLLREVTDSRFEYVFLDAHHAMFNPNGDPLSSETTLPLEENEFDVACLFSVITHQNSTQSKHIFSLLHRYVCPDGYLFFTCFIDDTIAGFEDRSSEQNGGRCFYNTAFLTQLVESCGWRFLNHAPGEGPLIGDSFLFWSDVISDI